MTLHDEQFAQPEHEASATHSSATVETLIASRAFVTYVQALNEWLDAPPSDLEVMRPATEAICGAMHAAGVQPEQVLALMRRTGAVPAAFSTARASRERGVRYSRAVWLLLRHAFGEERSAQAPRGHTSGDLASPSVMDYSPPPFAWTVEALQRWLDEPAGDANRLRAETLRLCDRVVKR